VLRRIRPDSSHREESLDFGTLEVLPVSCLNIAVVTTRAHFLHVECQDSQYTSDSDLRYLVNWLGRSRPRWTSLEVYIAIHDLADHATVPLDCECVLTVLWRLGETTKVHRETPQIAPECVVFSHLAQFKAARGVHLMRSSGAFSRRLISFDGEVRPHAW
jgi:hypothetical protein